MLLAVLRDLFPLLAALYALDGLAWVGALDLLFVRWAWGWSVFEGRGVRLAGILPLDLAFPAAGPVAIPTADALFVPGPEVRRSDVYDPERWTRLPWDRIAVEREERTIRLGPGRRVRLPSSEHARDLAGLLEEIRTLEPEARERRLAQVRSRAFDFDAAVERLGTFREKTQLLRIVTWGLSVLVLLLLPAVLYLHPAPDRLLVPLLLGIAVLYAATLFFAARSGPRLLAPMLLSPMSSLRAVREVGRSLFHDLDPLTVAALLLRRDRLLARARAELHGAAWAAERGEEGWRRHWRGRRKALLRLLEQAGIGEAEALAAPVPRDPSARSWCPVCGTELESVGGDCGDCGLPLAAFPDRT